MSCNNPECDGEWITEPPLQDGGMCAVRQCPVCAAEARREAEREEARRMCPHEHAVNDWRLHKNGA